MPELPDIVIYIEALERRIAGATLERVRLVSMFLVRSVAPPIAALTGKRVQGLRRLGKRIVICFEGELFLVIHLMIAGRLQWKDRGAKASAKNVLATLDFSTGSLMITEAGSKKRASLHVVQREQDLQLFNRQALEVLDATLEAFKETLQRENHTLKRALTDPRLFSGIGNAYSDEILHRARLSPMKLTASLAEEEVRSLFAATRAVLQEWTSRLRQQSAGVFPSNVTAFRPEMAAHGRYGKPCPVCGSPIQRIVYADNECNYCATCQTGGRLLADRAMSRLLKNDWPRSLDEMEKHFEERRTIDFFPSPNFNERPTGTPIDTIVVHATVLNTLDEVIRHFSNAESKVSAHYTVDRDGRTISHVPETKRAWHAGQSQMPDGREDVNNFSIGIELVNRNDGVDPYPKTQIQALKNLIAAIKSRHPVRYVIPHYACADPPGRKTDPVGFREDWI